MPSMWLGRLARAIVCQECCSQALGRDAQATDTRAAALQSSRGAVAKAASNWSNSRDVRAVRCAQARSHRPPRREGDRSRQPACHQQSQHANLPMLAPQVNTRRANIWAEAREDSVK